MFNEKDNRNINKQINLKRQGNEWKASKTKRNKQHTMTTNKKTLFRSPGRFQWSAFLATMSHSFPYFLMIFVGPLVHGVSRLAALALTWFFSHVFFVWKGMDHRNLTAQPVSTFSIMTIVTLAFSFRFRMLGPRFARPRFYLNPKHLIQRERERGTSETQPSKTNCAHK